MSKGALDFILRLLQANFSPTGHNRVFSFSEILETPRSVMSVLQEFHVSQSLENEYQRIQTNSYKYTVACRSDTSGAGRSPHPQWVVEPMNYKYISIQHTTVLIYTVYMI